MTMKNQNFTMKSGDSKNLIVPVIKGDGSALDLTGASFIWVLRKKEHSIEISVQKTLGAGIFVNGDILTIKLFPEDTSNLSGDYFHECKMSDQHNNVSSLFEGIVSIRKSSDLVVPPGGSITVNIDGGEF